MIRMGHRGFTEKLNVGRQVAMLVFRIKNEMLQLQAERLQCAGFFISSNLRTGILYFTLITTKQKWPKLPKL